MKRILANLSMRQRISIAAVALLAGVLIYALVHWQHEADFKPLFTGVPAEDAAAIVQKLKESGVEYRLPGDGSILVPSARLAELRLNMAAAGLPKTGRIGFELFDKINLGATEFSEHVNYRRALEGELERSVMSLAEVEAARVHLTFPKESVFLESRQPAKASVMLKLRPGAHLAPQNVQAIDHLVASAVDGLSPDAVSVIDMNGNLLGRPKAAGGLDGTEGSEAALDYRKHIESDLLGKISSTLEPLLGANRFRAGVSVECDFSGGEQSEEIFDPTRSVMMSSQRSEDGAGMSSAGGIPGTASALPRPAPKTSTAAGRASRVTENITYQTSRTVKKMRIPAGGVRRMSLALLVDQEISWERNGNGFRRVLTPPTPEKLKVLRDLVTGVTGFNAERGDQIVVESLPFESTLMLEPPQSGPAPAAPPAELPFRLKWDRRTILVAGSAAGGLLLLLAGAAIVLRRRRRNRKAEATAAAELAAPTGTPALPGGVVEDRIESKLAERAALQQHLDGENLNALQLAPVITKAAEVLAKHLREKISKEPDISAQILRTWIREEENG